MPSDWTQDPKPPPSPSWKEGLAAAGRCPCCGARTRAGGLCRQPAMPNGRCRMHGGCSTGPKTAEGLARLRAARTIHGGRGAEARDLRAMIRELNAGTKRLCEVV
jgi:hypothetical protein